MNRFEVREIYGDIELRALRYSDGAVSMDIGSTNPRELGHIIILNKSQVADLVEFLQNGKN